MTTVSTKSGKVVSREEEKNTLTVSDSEMYARAIEAVKAAINKAKICKKTVAGYDKEKKAAYVEYANGEKRSVESYDLQYMQIPFYYSLCNLWKM